MSVKQVQKVAGSVDTPPRLGLEDFEGLAAHLEPDSSKMLGTINTRPVVRKGIAAVELPGGLLDLDHLFRDLFLEPKLSAFQMLHLSAALAIANALCRVAVRDQPDIPCHPHLHAKILSAGPLHRCFNQGIQLCFRHGQSNRGLGTGPMRDSMSAMHHDAPRTGLSGFLTTSPVTVGKYSKALWTTLPMIDQPRAWSSF